MSTKNVYFKCSRNVEVTSCEVSMKDLGSLRCSDPAVAAKLKALRVHRFGEGKPRRVVISSIRLIQLMEEACQGIQIQILGEPDVLVEYVQSDAGKGWKHGLLCTMVCLVAFFGTAFTIMAYHNDVEINKVFADFYRVVMGREADGVNVLEVSYSVGLAVGIILFFNHVGGRRITRDPTPIEVAMRNYEEDVDAALIETASREKAEIEEQ